MARVLSLHRYPIKGFEGEILDSVSLVCGEGVPGDRITAITRAGAVGAAPFQQLTTNENLVHFVPGRCEGGLTLHERGPGASDDLLSNAARLREHFGEQAGVINRQDRLGHWDFDDSMLSIINVATVEALSALTGVWVDPLRFRGNIYIEAEPFSEFDWLGCGVQFGQACLSIIRPIKRCRATSVNPRSGALDLNTPAQLNRHFGHMYCGVYAQVERAGTLRPGDAVVATHEPFAAKLAIAATVAKAPPTVSWPRAAKVLEIIEEAPGVRSIWLQDPLAKLGSLEKFVAGQHVALHSLNVSGAWRRYTVSGIQRDRLRVTVKRETGVGSAAIHALEVGQLVHLTGPLGPDTLDVASPAHLILSAGIGITPTITKLAALAQANYSNAVRVVHTVRHRHELALWGEVMAIAQRLSNSSTALHVSRGTEGLDGAFQGRPDLAAVIADAASKGASIHVCGPERFQTQVLTIATQAGIAHRLHMDSFAAPDSPVEMRDIPDCGPFKVTFQRSGVSAHWHPKDGTLLSLAETKGLVVPAHCRAGLCLTCECRLVSGEVLPLTEISKAASGHLLMCVAVPQSDIVLDC